MLRLCFVLLLTSVAWLSAEPLANLVDIKDGLDVDNPENIADDYIRLQLHNPSYSVIQSIAQQVAEQLGPDMTELQSAEWLLVQAPRDGSTRIEFIAWLLQLEIPLAQAEQ